MNSGFLRSQSCGLKILGFSEKLFPHLLSWKLLTVISLLQCIHVYQKFHSQNQVVTFLEPFFPIVTFFSAMKHLSIYMVMVILAFLF